MLLHAYVCALITGAGRGRDLRRAIEHCHAKQVGSVVCGDGWMSLEALGWNTQWREKFEAHAATGLVPARVVGEHRSHYRVATEATELSASTTGRMRNTVAQRSDLPGVGDFVAVNLSEGDSPATIEVVLPRTSALIRKASGKARPAAAGSECRCRLHRDRARRRLQSAAHEALSCFSAAKRRCSGDRGQQVGSGERCCRIGRPDRRNWS